MRGWPVLAVAALAGAAAIGLSFRTSSPEWSPAELRQIASLSLASLPARPPDPSNRFADDPAAAALGRKLFFDARLSGNGMVACASCHQPGRQFQDDRPTGQGMAIGARRTMPLAGAAYFPFLFWDGRKDSLWSQVLGPLENPAEHGADRTMIVRLIAAAYGADYEALFGPLPAPESLPAHAMPDGPAEVVSAWRAMTVGARDEVDRAYANIGKSIAAFERTIVPEAGRFDAYADALAAGDAKAPDAILSANERAGLRLFIGKGNCVTCHNGPLLTDNAFHNLGLPGADPSRDGGRSTAAAVLKDDPFNCLGRFSDADPADCTELRFMEITGAGLVGAFRSPSLRGVASRAPFMHAGQFATLDALLAHYNSPPEALLGRSELKPLGLSADEIGSLKAFLGTLGVPATGSGRT